MGRRSRARAHAATKRAAGAASWPSCRRPDGTLGFFAEDHAGFYWPAGEAGKSGLRGARLLLNGGVIAAVTRPGEALPEPPALEPFEGRERWEVVLYGTAGRDHNDRLRHRAEGVSREIATRVFDAVRAALEGGR